MSVLIPVFGLWSERDAVLWPERTHPPTYLTGPAFAVWDAVARRGVDPDAVEGVGLDPDGTRRILDGLEGRGLLASPPDPLGAAALDDEEVVTVDSVAVPVAAGPGATAGWPTRPAPGELPVLRVRALPDGSRLVANALNGLPLAVAEGDGALGALVAAARRLAHGTADRLAIPLEAWRTATEVVLVSPVLVTRPDIRDACSALGVSPSGSPVTDLRGVAVAVEGRPVTGLLLDQSWAAANPEGGPLALHWLLACLLATVNPVAVAGRYALLDAATRLAQDRAVAWAASEAPERVPDLLATLPGSRG